LNCTLAKIISFQLGYVQYIILNFEFKYIEIMSGVLYNFCVNSGFAREVLVVSGEGCGNFFE